MSQEIQSSSIAALEEKTASHPDSVGDIHELADDYADQGQWEKAIEAYQSAICLDESNSDLHTSLGTVYEELGKRGQAQYHYQRAIALNPKDSLAYYNLGALLEDGQRKQEAVEAYKKCLKHATDPDERFEVKQILIRLKSESSQAETSTGQSHLAYRLTAVILLVGVGIKIVEIVLGDTSMIAPRVIDFILAIGLIQLRPGARGFALFRAVAGAILWPILAFVGNDTLTAIVVTVIQWAFCGSIIVLLTGRTKTWRLALAMGVFVVFVLGVYGMFLLLFALAQLLGA
jgi:hypothetical protein